MANDLLYAFAQDTILALPAQAGLSDAQPTPLWRDTAYNGIAVSSISLFINIYPAFVDKDVIVIQNEVDDSATNMSDTYMTVLDGHSRSLLWRAKSEVTIGNTTYLYTSGPVTVVGNVLYCVFPANSIWSICAFDLHSGRILWSFPMNRSLLIPAVTYSAGKLYIGQINSFVCLRADNGKQIWEHNISGDITATAIVANDVVYFGALDGVFYALDAQSGKLRWHTNLNAQVTAAALIANDIVYIGDANGYLWALDAATGYPAWPKPVFAGFDENQDAGTVAAAIVYPPIIYRNLVAVAAGDTFSAIDLRYGTRRWPHKVQQKDKDTRGIATCPIIFGNYFVIGDSSNHVIALNP